MLRCTFYAFSGTNILTRCHSATTCFWFQKSYTGNILGIGREKNRRSYIYRANTEDREGVKEGQQGGQTLARRGPRLGMVWPPWAATDLASPPI